MTMPLHDRIATAMFWLIVIPLILLFLAALVASAWEAGFSFWLLPPGLLGVLGLVFGIRQCCRVLLSGKTSR